MARLPSRAELIQAYARLSDHARERGVEPEVADVAKLADADIVRLGRELRAAVCAEIWLRSSASGLYTEPDIDHMKPAELVEYERAVNAHLEIMEKSGFAPAFREVQGRELEPPFALTLEARPANIWTLTMAFKRAAGLPLDGPERADGRVPA